MLSYFPMDFLSLTIPLIHLSPSLMIQCRSRILYYLSLALLLLILTPIPSSPLTQNRVLIQ